MPDRGVLFYGADIRTQPHLTPRCYPAWHRRDKRKVVDWARYGNELCRRLPPAGPLEIVRLIDEAVGRFDEAVISAIFRMRAGLTPDYQRIPEEESLLARGTSSGNVGRADKAMD